MSISGQLGAFVAVAVGYVLIAFLWGWYKRRSAEREATDVETGAQHADSVTEDG